VDDGLRAHFTALHSAVCALLSWDDRGEAVRMVRLHNDAIEREAWEMLERFPEALPEAPAERLEALVTLVEKALRDLLRLAPTDDAAPAVEQTPADTIIAHGNKVYTINLWEPRIVADDEDTVLRAFLRQPAMTSKTLEDRTELVSPAKLLRALTTRYDARFAPAIKLPGGKGKGGYFVRIREADGGRAAPGT
jgi:hypothetical protein